MSHEDHPRRSDSERRLRQASRFARVLRMLDLIQSRGRYGVNDLARELDCSSRTVFRDLNVLELAGVPWYHDESDHCYRVRPDFHFPVVNLTDDELIGQATATAICSSPNLNINAGAEPTTRKISTASRAEVPRLLDDVQRVTEVLDLKLADHSRHHAIVHTVQQALIHRRQLTGTYATPYQQRPRRLMLHPYRLCLMGRAWYLIARPADAIAPRTLRAARFKSLRMLEQAAEMPADFDLQLYLGNAWSVYRGEPTYEVELQFTPDAADVVAETTWHATQKVRRHRDGAVTLTFRVDGLNEIVHWVLGWAGRVTVVGPLELRSLIREHLERALVMNGNDLESLFHKKG